MATLLPDENVGASELHGYRIFVFSHDHPRPSHVHVGKGKRYSSWNIMTLQCTDSGGFPSSDIRIQRTILSAHIEAVRRSWHAHWQNQ
jgi:hypothetical protein